MLPLLPRRVTAALALTACVLACMDEPITTSAVDQPDSTFQPGSDHPAALGLYNPVYPADFPDPYVLPTDAGYFAYSTNSGFWNVPLLYSSDLMRWSRLGDALPRLPGWAVGGRRLTWAPSVLKISSGYLMFYTARERSSGRQCIGRAEGSSPAGPFSDESDSPFLCQIELGGSIDPSTVQDSTGQIYLIWKNDGNCCGAAVSLWAQRLSADGRSLIGAPSELLQRDQPWEGSLIEGPTMWEEQGAWHLLYSANRWNSGDYATGYARCVSPMGPCQKTRTSPLLMSAGDTAGPGGGETFIDRNGQRWLAYHAWSAARIGYRNGGVRSLRLMRLDLAPTDLVLTRPAPDN
jgi:beta-xylosidase